MYDMFALTRLVGGVAGKYELDVVGAEDARRESWSLVAVHPAGPAASKRVHVSITPTWRFMMVTSAFSSQLK